MRPQGGWRAWCDDMRDPVTIRNLIAFWIFGLCNNFAYVIMLSAAEDIIAAQDPDENGPDPSNSSAYDNICETQITGRHCAQMSTGYVLLADIIPSLVIKVTFPFFMQRIPFGIRLFFVIAMQFACYFIVAYSVNIVMSLTGVAFASGCSGLGEITLLSLTSYYDKSMISSWSSGTGGAGVVGSFAYAALTEPTLGGLTPKQALLTMLVVPVLFTIAYYIVLVMPEAVYRPGLNPKTWIVPLNVIESTTKTPDADLDESSRLPSGDSGDPIIATHQNPFAFKKDPEELWWSTHSNRSEPDETSIEERDTTKVPQRPLSWSEKARLIPPLLKYMIPLAVVYFAEYLINQGMVELIFFDCSEGFGLHRSSQYRWYQVLYQVGVFISRSSVSCFELPTIVLYLLPIMQIGNMLLFFFDALYFFIPHIAIIFVLILIEGLFGGASYVNTFNKIHREVAPDVREYSISVASSSDSFGIVVSGFASIPLHNFICNQPIPGVPGS